MIFYMVRLLQRTVLTLAIAGAVPSASAFSLLGPFDTWQVAAIGYNPLGTDIGGPMNLGEEYRWNVKTITYGFDESFLNYFGAQGTAAVMQAIAILNALPPVSQMSSDLSEFPLESKRMNYRASALRLLDLKSEALGLLLEEMGLASPERYVWTLRDSRVIAGVTYYLTIMRNFDPVTRAPSKYVNGTLYTYAIIDPIQVLGGSTFADAVEIPVDPLAFTFTAVASQSDRLWGGGLYSGESFSGLTRDDVGSLRYLYRPNNYNIENLIPGTTAAGLGSGSPWTPIYPTNVLGSNVVVDLALRPGVDKVAFQFRPNDSIFGNFATVTNQYTDTYVTNSTLKTQNTQRVLTQPDILFSAEDLGLTAAGTPNLARRTACAAPVWVNNDALNGQAALAGPGQIQPQVVITFSKVGPYDINNDSSPFFLGEAGAYLGFVWGSFDGTTNDPVVYPIGSSIQDLEQRVLGGY